MSDTLEQSFELKSLEPNNTDAEGAVLGACLAFPENFDRLQGALERGAITTRACIRTRGRPCRRWRRRTVGLIS